MCYFIDIYHTMIRKIELVLFLSNFRSVNGSNARYLNFCMIWISIWPLGLFALMFILFSIFLCNFLFMFLLCIILQTHKNNWQYTEIFGHINNSQQQFKVRRHGISDLCYIKFLRHIPDCFVHYVPFSLFIFDLFNFKLFILKY